MLNSSLTHTHFRKHVAPVSWDDNKKKAAQTFHLQGHSKLRQIIYHDSAKWEIDHETLVPTHVLVNCQIVR